MSDFNYRRLFKDVVYGYSTIEIDGEELFLKHLSVLDQIELENLQAHFLDKAKKRGIPTEKESLERLIEEGIWSEKDDLKIIHAEKHEEALVQTKKNLYLKSEIDIVNKDIGEVKQKIAQLNYDKSIILGPTCEKYADSRVTDHYILSSFYTDKEFKNPKFDSKAVDELTQKELQPVIIQYNEKAQEYSEENIQKMVLQDFYSIYFPYSDNVMNYFHKPLFYLSSNQVRLLVFTRMYKNVFENYTEMPEKIRKDPEKIADYINAQDKAQDMAKHMDKEGASTIVGATDEDYKYLGYRKSPGKSISEVLKEKGGKMNMKDVMEMMT